MDPLPRELGRPDERRGERVETRSEIHLVKGPGRDEAAVHEYRRIADRPDRPPGILRKAGDRPLDVREHLWRDPERDGGLRAGPLPPESPQRGPQPAQDVDENAVAGEPAHVLAVHLQRGAKRVYRAGRAGQQLAAEDPGRAEPCDGQRDRTRRSGEERDPLLRRRFVGRDPALGQRFRRVPHRPPGPENLADADKGLEGVRERYDLTGAPHALARNRGYEPVVEAVHHEAAEPRRGPGVGVGKVDQARGEQGAGLRRGQERRRSDGAPEEQVPLMFFPLQPPQALASQVAHSGVHPVHAPAVRERVLHLGVGASQFLEQLGMQPQGLAVEGDVLYRLQVQVSRVPYRDHALPYPVGIRVPSPASSARRRIRYASATSVVASPLCQKRIFSPSPSRPAACPARISPSSACRFSRVSSPVST